MFFFQKNTGGCFCGKFRGGKRQVNKTGNNRKFVSRACKRATSKNVFCVFFGRCFGLCTFIFFNTRARRKCFFRARTCSGVRTSHSRSTRTTWELSPPHTHPFPARTHTHHCTRRLHPPLTHHLHHHTKHTPGQPRGASSSVSLRLGDRGSAGVLLGCRWGAWRACLAQVAVSMTASSHLIFDRN